MKFATALREEALRRVEAMERTDIVVGIPAYNNNSTIRHVVETVSGGLHKYFSGMRSVIIVSDGGSVDDTREQARSAMIHPWIERLVSIYRGIPGKGSAIRQVFEVADFLGAKACAMFDSDLRSIKPEWVRNLLRPITEGGYDYIAPYYNRYKYDGTITNNIVYILTRALYGRRVRQPIGGDFAFSPRMVKSCIDKDVWQTDVGRFGIDIWLTTTAILQGFNICQSRLGVKVHDIKDPAAHLGPMFCQVVDTMMEMMEENVDFWVRVKGSEDVPICGDFPFDEPEAFKIDRDALITRFKTGHNQFRHVWKNFLDPESYEEIKRIARLKENAFSFPAELWTRILCDYAVTFHAWEHNRYKLTTLMTPLYYARIASFINETIDMTNGEAENVIEKSATIFEEMKPYLVQRWRDKSEELGWKEPKKIDA
jgi:glycosyltransferase involved in cell wall biosynthesis